MSSKVSIANMKKILHKRGISTEGMLDKAEIEQALQNSNALAASIGAGGGGQGPRNPVRVIVLAERHYSDECDVKNIRLLTEFLKERRNVPDETILFVSEGENVNPCYSSVGIPPSNVIVEYESPEKPTYHYFQLFMLYTEVFEQTVRDEIPHNKRELTSNGVSIKNFLLKVPDMKGIQSYIKLRDLCLMNNEPEYRKELLKLYQLLHDHAFNDETPEEKAFLQRLARSMIEHGGHFDYAYSAGGPLEEIYEKREKTVINKMKMRVEADPSITTVVIIFGKKHYNNFKRHFSQSPMFIMDDSLSNISIANSISMNNVNNAINERNRKIAIARGQRKRKTRRTRKTRKTRRN